MSSLVGEPGRWGVWTIEQRANQRRPAAGTSILRVVSATPAKLQQSLATLPTAKRHKTFCQGVTPTADVACDKRSHGLEGRWRAGDERNPRVNRLGPFLGSLTMSEMKLAVLGAAGRMGQTLARAIAMTEGCVLAAGIEAKGSPAVGRDLGEVAGLGPLGIPITDDPLPVFAEVHGVLDFTTPKATVAFAGLAAQARIVDVIGTTGLSADDHAKIEAAARHAAIVKAGNMSLGVNLLAGLTARVARTLGPEFDIEILELHHRHKRDAPSGTALLLGEAAASGRSIALKDHSARARDGDFGPRREGDIGFAALRGGTVTGDHSVIFAGAMERIELTHRAEDRTMFAQGAVKAALWARHQKPGLYSMADVLGLKDF